MNITKWREEFAPIYRGLPWYDNCS